MYIAIINDRPVENEIEYKTIREAWDALKAHYTYFSENPRSEILVTFDTRWNHEVLGTVYADGKYYIVANKEQTMKHDEEDK